jgi:hypothetical protein
VIPKDFQVSSISFPFPRTGTDRTKFGKETLWSESMLKGFVLIVLIGDTFYLFLPDGKGMGPILSTFTTFVSRTKSLLSDSFPIIIQKKWAISGRKPFAEGFV